MFRDHSIAWAFHRNTYRWPYNTLSPDDGNGVMLPFKEYLSAPVVPLPAAAIPAISMQEMIAKRCSCRNYKEVPLPLAGLATVLKTGYGVTGKTLIGEMEFFERPVPSGGGLYPLELYVIAMHVEGLPQGVYHYSPASHMLEEVAQLELSYHYLSNLFMHQPYLHHCGAVVVLTSVMERNMKKYTDRGYRYILFEAGHCVQNMNLVAAGTGLGTLNLGGFFDDELGGLLRLDADEEVPLYCMAIGIPVEKTKNELRIPPVDKSGD